MDPQAQPPVTFFAMMNEPNEANSSLVVLRRRIPTSGDASMAIRARLPGPSRPDDERCRDS